MALISYYDNDNCDQNNNNNNDRNDNCCQLQFDDVVNESYGHLSRPLIFRRFSRTNFAIFGFFGPSSTDDVLSSQRVNQMTKVYYDIDAATLLLEERERDLELAARIGQSLLERNNELNTRNEVLEQRLGTLNEIVAQLHHKLELKSDLLAFYTQALDSVEDEEENRQHNDDSPGGGGGVFQRGSPRFFAPADDYPTSKTSVSVQCDNLANDESGGLLQTCLKQLTYLSDEVERLTCEVATKTSEVLRQQEEIESLTTHIFNLKTKLTQSDDENARMGERLEEAKDAQSVLANEVGGLKSRYDECLDLLREAQQEIRALKKRQRTGRAVVHYFNTTPSTADPPLPTNDVSTPTRSNSLLMAAAGETPTGQPCACRSNSIQQRRISSDCDSDAGYAADSDSMLESLVCSPNPSGSNNLSIRTLSPCISSSASPCSANPPSTPNNYQKSPNLGLKLVKPIEGSVTLHRWTALAHPTLSSSALDSLPGILAKEHDPVSDIPLHRHGNKIDDPYCDDEDEADITLGGSGCSLLPPNSRSSVFLLDDEEELYGDFEVVERRPVLAPSDVASTRSPMARSQEAYEPAHQIQPVCCLEINGVGGCNDTANFHRLAGLHRHKGQQGLNLSPPVSSGSPSKSFVTLRPVMLTPPKQSEPSSNSSKDEKQQQPQMCLAFYHPSPLNTAADGTGFNFASSFLPKYRHFLLKHRLVSQSNSSSNKNSKNEDLDESLEDDDNNVAK